MKVVHWPALLHQVSRDHRPIKAICVAISAYFLYHELNLFFIVRPTSNSDEITHLSHHLLPDISICPVPAFDMDQLQSAGYPDIFHYYLGLDSSYLVFQGWGGETGEEPGDLLDTLATVGDTTAANNTWLGYFYTSGEYTYIQAEVKVIGV